MKYRCIVPMFDNSTCQSYELNRVYELDDKTAKRFDEIKCLNRFVPAMEPMQPKKKA